MKIISYILYLMLAILCGTIVSCQQIAEDDDWFSEGEEKSLKVKVRSAGEAELEYPLYLYAFAESGKLAASQVISDDEEDMSLTLSKGDFHVVAIAGTSDSYQLPENPELDDVVTMVGSKGAETPLMVGRANVEIGSSSTATAQITLSYVVAALNVELKEVPSNVSAVQLSLSPLYSNLSMGGDYGGESQKVKVDCSEDADGSWSAETVYIFPGVGEKTIFSIHFKMNNGSEVTYGYTFQGTPEANHLFNVTGTYAGGVIVGGSFDVDDWEGSIDVEFNFGANVVPDDEEDDDKENEVEDDEDVDLTGVPEVGTIWNDMIVADMGEADEEGVELLLMSLDEWDATISQADDVPDGYSVNGVSGWRLPTHEEATLLRARFSGDNRLELNELIAEYNEQLYGLDGEERYLCTKNGVYYSFRFAGGTTISKAGEKRSYYVRLVKSYRYSVKE